MLNTILRLLDIIPIHKYHQFVGSFRLKIPTVTPNIDQLLRLPKEGAADTYPVVQSCLKGWLQKDLTQREYNNCGNWTRWYGKIMIKSLKLTWAMNAGSDFEKTSFFKLPGLTKNSHKVGPPRTNFEYRTP